MHPFIAACLESYQSAPAVARMKSDGPSGRWAADLLRLSEHEELSPLRRVLTEIARDGLRTLYPMVRFADTAAAAIPGRRYAQASAFGVEQLGRSPGAAYVITLMSVFGWATSLGAHLTEQVDGMPDRGWVDIPYAYARAALDVGDVRGAKRVVDTAYDTLMAARYPEQPGLVAAITKYRTLAGTVARRLEQTVDNLADELLGSSLRTHLLALMWTLGFVPECEGLRRSGQPLSRPMVRTLIRLSMDRIPHDPLTQYVWLEMKDKPSLDLRGHHFFYVINRRYNQYLLDDIEPVIPSQAYAQTLIMWLDGTLGPDGVTQYGDVVEKVRQFEKFRGHSPCNADWSVFPRMFSLGYLLAGEYDRFVGDPSPAQQMAVWRSVLDDVIRMRSRHHLNPHMADPEGTLNYPLFHVIEQGLGPDADDYEMDPAKVLHDVERYRAAAMAFSLAVTPPSTPASHDGELTELLATERELIDWLRGAYFLVNYIFLPAHFRRYTTEIWPDNPGDTSNLDTGRRDLNLETGRRDYVEVERLLGELYDRMSTTAGEYAARRTHPAADVERIVKALGQHSRPTGDTTCAPTGRAQDSFFDRRPTGVTIFVSLPPPTPS